MAFTLFEADQLQILPTQPLDSAIVWPLLPELLREAGDLIYERGVILLVCVPQHRAATLTRLCTSRRCTFEHPSSPTALHGRKRVQVGARVADCPERFPLTLRPARNSMAYEAKPDEGGNGKVGTGKVGTGKVGTGEGGNGKVGTGKVGTGRWEPEGGNKEGGNKGRWEREGGNREGGNREGGTGVPPVQGEKISRRHLPHWQREGAVYFLTWRQPQGGCVHDVPGRPSIGLGGRHLACSDRRDAGPTATPP